MSTELKKVESRIYLKYFGDGLWDILIGLMITLFGVGMITDLPYLAGITVPLGYVSVSQIKAKITYPRIGYIKFKKTKKRLAVILIANIFLVGLVFFTTFFFKKESSLVIWLHDNINLFLGFVFGGALALTAFLTQSARFYAYAAVMFFLVFVSKWVGSLELNLTLAGGIVLLAGFYVLIRFLKTYPLDSTNKE